jgi:hypothetical protein
VTRRRHWSRGITKEEHDEQAAEATRPLTDDHPGLRQAYTYQQPEGFKLIDKFVQPTEEWE